MTKAGEKPFADDPATAPLGRDEDISVKWHALETIADVCRELGNVTTKGLTSEEAAQRQEKYGFNRLTPPEKVSIWTRIWLQINNVLIYILLVAAAFSVYFGASSDSIDAWIEFALIILVIVINITIGIIQEGKAERAAEAIKAMLSSKATVFRGGDKVSIDAELLVPGDVIFLKSGDRVPADVRMVQVNRLQVQEAMLTGESNPVHKNTLPVEAHLGIGDRKCMAYSATMVTSGEATAIVCETADSAEIGRINQLVCSVERVKTNLLVQLEILGVWIAIFVCTIAVAAFFLGLFGPYNEVWTSQGKIPWEQAFKNSIAIAVAMIPEGLPAVVTITLALGVSEMAKNNAIIRQLPCVETLGSLMVICSDKTGTLTKNEMTVIAAKTAKSQFDVTGIGYAPNGSFVQEGNAPATDIQLEFIRQLMVIGALCNTSSVVKDVDVTGREKWEAHGNPTEAAILVAAKKAGIDIDNLRSTKPCLGSIPFESHHKFMATVHSDGSDTSLICVKGATDRLLSLCQDQVIDDDFEKKAPVDKAYWQQATSDLSSRGLRVLALCVGRIPADTNLDLLDPSFITKGGVLLTMAGLVAILDPPREECISAIEEAHSAAIEVKMITGDHAETAMSIARTLKIVDETNDGIVYTGPQLDAMTEKEMEEAVMKCNVFARSSPENKIQIVQALQARHQVSSMTGDGVNDAPALKAANIGVAMGITGTDVSKEAAQMVLADDNFATIVVAVKEGRRVWDNLRKILVFNLPVNLAQGFTVFFSLCFGDLGGVPLNAIQVLYVNMITSVTMGLMLAAEAAEADIMSRNPRRPNKRLLGKLVIWKCFFISLPMVVAVIGVFAWGEVWPKAYSFEQRSGEAFTLLIFMEIAYSVTTRYLKQSSFRREIIFGNKWAHISTGIVVLLQILILYVPGLNTLVFGVVGIDGYQWLRVLIITLVFFLIVELEKSMVDPILFPMIKPVLKRFGLVTPRYDD